MSKPKTVEGVPQSGDVRRIRGARSSPCESSAKDFASLLKSLKRNPPDKAWARFLQLFSPVLMKAANYHTQSSELAKDCFLFICEKLVERGFEHLDRFDPGRGVGFRSWLAAVANNLALDWHRQQFGRTRLPRAVQAMSELDQAVYRLKYLKRMENAACLALLRRHFPRIGRQQLSESLARLHQAFSPQARWRLSFVNRPRAQRQVSYESGFVTLDFDNDDAPHEEAVVQQKTRHLERALAQLSTQQRLLLRLRFEQQLSLEQAARITGCSNLHQARRMIEKAITQLRGLLSVLED